MKKIILSLTTACLLLASCSKEKVSAPGNDPAEGVKKKLVKTTLNGVINITYNADGSPKQIITTQAANEYTKSFTYSPGKANYISYMDGMKAEIGEYTLVNGKAVAFDWTYFDAAENPIKSFHETFTYTGNGLLEKHIFDNGDYRFYEYDGKSNLVRFTSYYANGQAFSKVEFTSTDKPDRFPWLNDFNSWGSGFFLPPVSKDLAASYKTTNLLTNTVQNHFKYSYEFDNDGYALKVVVAGQLAGSGTYEWNNTFQ